MVHGPQSQPRLPAQTLPRSGRVDPQPGGCGGRLGGVAAVSTNDVWAVGNAGGDTLTEHWDGTSWSIVPSPHPGASTNELFEVVALSTNDVWAVGYYYDGSTDATLTEHWDGTAWSVV